MTTYDKAILRRITSLYGKGFRSFLYLYDYFDVLIEYVALESRLGIWNLEYIGMGKSFLILQCFFLLFDLVLAFLFALLLSDSCMNILWILFFRHGGALYPWGMTMNCGKKVGRGNQYSLLRDFWNMRNVAMAEATWELEPDTLDIGTLYLSLAQ